MKQGKETMLTDHMEGFKEKQINYQDYEISFRRWLVSQIDTGNMGIEDARDRFHLSGTEYKMIIMRWPKRYSDEIYLSMSVMSAKEEQISKRWRSNWSLLK